MKRLFVMRHAKAQGSHPDGDHARLLAPRGRVAARRMGRFLELAREVPELAICSSSARTLETLQLASEAGSWEIEKRERGDLYLAATSTVLDAVRETEERVESLLIVGHEPFCSRVVGELCGGLNVRFKPACIARLDLAVSVWSDVAHDRGELRWLVTPKMFSHGGFEFADAIDADV